MTGGQAVQSGIGFQDKVAAIMAVYALADEPLPFLDLPGNVTLKTVELETNAPVDDILVKTSANGFCFINVKKSVGISEDPKSPLGSVIDQFVRQWIACLSCAGIREWERPLDPEKDRLVLVTGGTRAQTLFSAVSSILKRIADRQSIQPKEDIATTNSERRAYEALVNLLRFFWGRHLRNIPSEAEIASILGMTRVALVDPDNTDKAPALALLRRVVLGNPDDAENAWSHLVIKCHQLAERRSSADQGALREVLRTAEYSLRNIPDLKNDINHLEIFTSETLDYLTHLAHLPLPKSEGSKSFKINRRVTQVLVDCAERTSLLLISPPGAGKSGALYWAAKQLREQGHPVVVVAVERHPVKTLDELIQNFGLSGSFFDVLKGWTTSKSGIFFIDALDATRGGPSDRVFQELIRSIHEKVPGWRVVASVRVFDLRFGVKYRELFAGSTCNTEFYDPEFTEVSHLLVPRLSDGELDQVRSVSPDIDQVYRLATFALRELLSNPFNLFLLATILSTGGLPEDFSSISTQIELMELYWSYRIIGNDQNEAERENLLRCIAEDMIEKGALLTSWRTANQYGGKSLHQLLSDGVLLPAKARGDQVYSVAFSHHVLFDYTVARLVLEGGFASDLIGRLSVSDDRALLMAPATIIAFRMLWQEDSSKRAVFWDKAFNVAEAEHIGAFSRKLPANVAAELTGQLEDFAPVMECLRRTDCLHRKAACFLVQHCLGVLVAGIVPGQRVIGPTASPWSQIVRELAETAIEDVGWMIKPIIAQWAEKAGELTLDQKRNLGEAARRLLIFGSGARYEEGAVIIGIQAIARTFETAPTESFDTLKLLFKTDHALAYGYRELFWLAKEFDHLITQKQKGPELLAELYKIAYCTPLPSGDEQCNLGSSRILGLLSNKKQDFEMVRHMLEERFAKFVDLQPVLAVQALIVSMECYTREKQKQEGEDTTFSFGMVQAFYKKDWSYLWMSHRGNERHPLLQSFSEGLGTIAETKREYEIDTIIQAIISQNRLACIWSSLLKAGVKHPAIFGERLFPLLIATPVLSGLDTRKSACDLLAILHPLLSPEKKRTVEEAILATDQESTQRILLGCLENENIVSEKAKQRRIHFEEEGPLPANREPFFISTGKGKGDEEWWLREQGVDLSVPENVFLNQTIKAVEAIKPTGDDDASCREYLKGRWNQVLELLHFLQNHPQPPEALLMSAWDTLAESAKKVAEVCNSTDELSMFPEIEDMVFGAFQDSLWPLPKSDLEEEKSFARFPSWSSPAPRIAASAALMTLARAKGEPDLDYSLKIEELTIDPSPAIRDQVFSRVNMLLNADSALMFRLCEQAFFKELNEGVLSSFLISIRNIISLRPEWFMTRVMALSKRDPSGEEGSRDRLNEVIVGLMVRLWLLYDQKEAGGQIRVWIKEPIKHSKSVQILLNSLHNAIVQGNPERKDPKDELIRSRAIEVFYTVVKETVPIFAEMGRRPSLDDSERKIAETAFHILDQIATEIYFGSGAYDLSHTERQGNEKIITTPGIRKRFLKEMEPTLKILAGAVYPSITHHLLETLEGFIPDDPEGVFRLVIDALIIGGQGGGYQYETMGAELFVRIIRRFLADFRPVLSEKEDCRNGLMRALDVFVEAGWPEARRLVYELPEMLR